MSDSPHAPLLLQRMAAPPSWSVSRKFPDAFTENLAICDGADENTNKNVRNNQLQSPYCVVCGLLITPSPMPVYLGLSSLSSLTPSRNTSMQLISPGRP